MREDFPGGKRNMARYPGRVMAGIALTALKPDHDHAYKSSSCYNHVAKAIAAGEVHDDDKIVLAGIDKLVCHVFVTRNDVPVIDSADIPGVKVCYDHDTGQYTASKEGHHDVIYERISAVSYEEFKRRYNESTLALGSSHKGPDPLSP
jgi:hypothetical protein